MTDDDKDQIREQVVQLFRETHDISVSFASIDDTDLSEEISLPLSDEQIQEIKEDNLFDYRIRKEEAEFKGQIIRKLDDLTNSTDHAVRLRATVKMGELFYPEKFVEVSSDDEVRPEIYLPDNRRD